MMQRVEYAAYRLQMLSVSPHLQAVVIKFGRVVHAIMRAGACHDDVGRVVRSKAVEQCPVVVLVHEMFPVIRDAHIAASNPGQFRAANQRRILSHCHDRQETPSPC